MRVAAGHSQHNNQEKRKVRHNYCDFELFKLKEKSANAKTVNPPATYFKSENRS
jgi:hypothetical protein